MFMRLLIIGLLFASAPPIGAADAPANVGVFEGQSDVGTVSHPGSATYDAATKTYTVSGSGANMWFAQDDFHFVWKQISAENVALTAGVSILGTGGDGHRKGVLMIRQSLDANSAYVDAARHGDGLTSLQYRESQGANTREIESNESGPTRLRLEKRGDRFYMWIASGSEELHFAGGSAKVELHAPFYVGIGVCAHNKDNVQQVAFNNVELSTTLPQDNSKYSTVETVIVASGDARVGYVSRSHVTDAGWSSDGHTLTFQNQRKQQDAAFTPLRTAAPVGAPVQQTPGDYTYFVSDQSAGVQIWRKRSGGGGSPEQITSDEFNNTSPSLSPDGKFLVFLSYSKEQKALPSEGGDVLLRVMSLSDRKIRTLAPFVGGTGSLGEKAWSPDGRRVVFVSYQQM